MSALRWTLVVLLVTSTALFAVGASIERSEADTHAEPATAQSEAAEPEGAHDEEGERTGRDGFGRLGAVLLAIAAIALVWAILDVREVAHQLDESRDGVAVIAMTVAVLHLAAAAVSGQLVRTSGTQTP